MGRLIGMGPLLLPQHSSWLVKCHFHLVEGIGFLDARLIGRKAFIVEFPWSSFLFGNQFSFAAIVGQHHDLVPYYFGAS